MKKYLVFLPLLIIPVIFLSAYRTKNLPAYNKNNKTIIPADSSQVLPDSVQQIVQNSCVGCHSTTSHSEKAREKLNFDDWSTYSPVKKISKLNDIHKEINEDKMPPEKFLVHFPDKKLTEVQKKIILDWTDKETDKIMN